MQPIGCELEDVMNGEKNLERDRPTDPTEDGFLTEDAERGRAELTERGQADRDPIVIKYNEVRTDNIIDGLIGNCCDHIIAIQQLHRDLDNLYETIFDEPAPEMDSDPKPDEDIEGKATITMRPGSHMTLEPVRPRRGLIGLRHEQRKLFDQIERAAFVLDDMRKRFDGEEGYRK